MWSSSRDRMKVQNHLSLFIIQYLTLWNNELFTVVENSPLPYIVWQMFTCSTPALCYFIDCCLSHRCTLWIMHCIFMHERVQQSLLMFTLRLPLVILNFWKQSLGSFYFNISENVFTSFGNWVHMVVFLHIPPKYRFIRVTLPDCALSQYLHMRYWLFSFLAFKQCFHVNL